MCEQTLATPCVGSVLAPAENHVLANRVGEGIDRSCRLCRARVAMHAHLAEVVPEARLHERARLGIKRLARRPQHVVDTAGNRRGLGATGGAALQAASLARAVIAFRFASGRSAA